MGQLVKLQDYISRYEHDVYRYPSRFVRLKKKEWEKLVHNWDQEEPEDITLLNEEEPSDYSLIKRLRLFFSRKKHEDQDLMLMKELQDEWEKESSELISFQEQRPQIEDIEGLKQYFLDQLCVYQLKWASSTIMAASYLDARYKHDQQLKYLLQRFPDNMLVFYQPIFLIRKAPFESETLLLTPTGLWCVHFLEEEENAVFVGSKDHFWTKKGTSQEKKVLNPMLALDRTEKVLRDIFQKKEISFPIKRAVLCRNGYIDYPNSPIGVELLEKRNVTEWFQKMRSERAPIKSTQLKAAKALLDFTHSIYSKRAEWTENNE